MSRSGRLQNAVLGIMVGVGASTPRSQANAISLTHPIRREFDIGDHRIAESAPQSGDELSITAKPSVEGAKPVEQEAKGL